MKNLKFTDSDRDYYLKGIRKLREFHSLVASITPDIEDYIKVSFPRLIGILPCLKNEVCFGNPFERIVVNKRVANKNTRLKAYKQIKYPPEEVLEKITYNRANLPKQSVFYAAYGSLTAALESKPEKGDLFTYSLWKQKQDTSIWYVPIFYKKLIVESTTEFFEDWKMYQKYLESLEKNVSIVVREVCDFIATVFTTKVDPNNKVEYLFSAIISDIYLNDPAHNVDCIYYPSVAGDFVASNIAIKPKVLENSFEIKEINESFCIRSELGKQWGSYRTAKAININPKNDLIEWQTETIYDSSVCDLLNHYKVTFE